MRLLGKKHKSAPGEPDRFCLEATARVDVVAAAEGEGPKQPSLSIDAYNGGILRVAGFYRPVVVDLAGLRAGRVTVLKDHDPSQIVGQGRATISSNNVTVNGQVTGDISDKNDPAAGVVSHAKNGFVWAASVGVTVERLENVEANSTATANGQTFSGPIQIVRAGRLGEVSIVGIGADETASTKIAASAAQSSTGEQEMKFSQWLQAMGLVESELTAEQVAKLQAKFDTEHGIIQAGETTGTQEPAPKLKVVAAGGAGETDPLAQRRLEAAAEERRIGSIRTLCGDKHTDICAQAIADGWTVDKAENAVLKASRPKAPSVQASVPGDAEPLVMEAGVMLMAKGVDVSKMYPANVLEAASRRWRHGLGIGEMLLIRAEQNTSRRYSMRHDPMQDILRAAFSTEGLSQVFSNLANKFLLLGYQYGDNSDLQIAARRPVNDFKTCTSYRMTGADSFQEVGPTGELKHGQAAEDVYTNQAKTYGLMEVIARTDIINDDLGVFDQMRKNLGMGASKKRRSVFWKAWMNNGAFFCTGNANYLAGASTALTMDGLTQAVQMMADQTDKFGEPIGIQPVILLVPTALSGQADGLYINQEIRDTNSGKQYTTGNIHRSKYRPVVSTYLGRSGLANSSAKAWHLLADPNEIATAEICYLNGVEAPTMEVAQADFNILGIQMRGYFDFGVSMQDPKAGVKMKGEA